jgi:hypothetical protein
VPKTPKEELIEHLRLAPDTYRPDRHQLRAEYLLLRVINDPDIEGAWNAASDYWWLD